MTSVLFILHGIMITLIFRSLIFRSLIFRSLIFSSFIFIKVAVKLLFERIEMISVKKENTS